MSEPLVWNENARMVYALTSKYLVGFGKRTLTFDQLIADIQALTGRQISWVHLKQTHSNTVLESHPEHATRDESLLREGDAHFSTQTNIGLIVKTADCLPVLMFSDDQILSVAVHAGWRGVENEILRATVRELKERGTNPAKLSVFIGPHIRQESFEVDQDVAQQLTLTAQTAGFRDSDLLRSIVQPNAVAGKHFVNLETVAAGQLTAEMVAQNKIHIYKSATGAPDTKTNSEWASYRRDGKNAGRNLSFIVKL